MNKLPAKQIYLLAIIIIGIIALSVYSTYALFTYESSTSEIVSIQTPKSLTISENIYEYQQITVEPNKVITTDIDIYNTFDYDVCYSIWYKIIENNIDVNKVQIFETSSDILTSSGVLEANEKIRVTIAIINDNDKTVKINLGTIGAKKENDSCSLNLTTDKNQISTAYKEIKILNEKILEEKETIKEEEENYIVYENQEETITYKDTEKIYLSDKFKYSNELFTLEEPIELTIGQIINQSSLEKKDIYFCKNGSSCQILYKATSIEEERTIDDEKNVKVIYYHIKKYDKLIGYSEGKNGLRKINEKDYIFYGDNPNNYIYYNCETDNTSTCELWRIIGLFYNEETEKYNIKIVKNDSIGKYQFDNKEENDLLTWRTSTLYEFLNKEYKLINNYAKYLEEYNQNIETLISLEEEIKSEKVEATGEKITINILNLSDYINSSICEKNKTNEYKNECLTNNWLNNIEIDNEWTSTIKIEKEIIDDENNEIIDDDENTDGTNEETLNGSGENTNEMINENMMEEPNNNNESNEIEEEPIINYAYGIGKTISEVDVNELLDIRPVVYLKSRILLVGGEGTFQSPYIIK